MEAPFYCQYANGPCDQSLSDKIVNNALFFYPSEPIHIASTVEAAKEKYKDIHNWKSWKDLKVQGQIIFCQICKEIRTSKTVIADVTTLNFNLLFEIGFCLGLQLPIIPIRDKTYARDERDFEELGIFDAIGCLDFTNATQLAEIVKKSLPGTPLIHTQNKIYLESPLFILKGHIETEGTIQLMSSLKKSALRFRTYDPKESPRISLYEALRQVNGSLGVITHLLSNKRKGHKTHNALCALVSGIALAQNKVVFILHEDPERQPIDYRDLVQPYTDPEQIRILLEKPIRSVVDFLQIPSLKEKKVPEKLLEKVDLGDIAAENEIKGLKVYFVRTGQFNQAKQGHARLVIGRKGSGKTAIFYEIRNSLGFGKSMLILDLKPEGHQFIKLKEAVINNLSPGLKEHTMTAFWNYILLSELAYKILETDASYSQIDEKRRLKYEKLKALYQEHDPGKGEDADFSQRLLLQVEKIVKRFSEIDTSKGSPKITELIYGSGDIRNLNDAICDYLSEKQSVWLLIDNIDKSWPTRGATWEDILVVRALLEATRKIQRQIEQKAVEFKCLVFLRTDIYESLLQDTSDKGKDTPINLDWDDPLLFKEVIRKRIQVSTELTGIFDDIWPVIFDRIVGSEDSFNYILDRTLMRPRDLLNFLHKSIDVALNRNHGNVLSEDIKQAEKSYSEDMLLMTQFEIEDTHPKYKNLLYSFDGVKNLLSKREIADIVLKHGLPEDEIKNVTELLLWFGFLGVKIIATTEEKFSYMVGHNLHHLMQPIEDNSATFIIHPGFHKALNIKV